jgi:hypothetical protein
MTQTGKVTAIEAVKRKLEDLKEKGIVKEWEIPYENIFTRLTAAIFFLSPTEESKLEIIWNELGTNKSLQYKLIDPK